jgi:hypothetical protein
LASACGGGSDTLSTGIPPNTSLGNLTPEQNQKLCVASETFLRTKVETLSCLIQALVPASLAASTDVARMQCKTAYNACVSQLATSSGGSADGGTSSTTTCKMPTASCTATVGEFETCLNDSSAAYDNLQGTLPSCDELHLPLMIDSSVGSTVTEPASCTKLSSECPDITSSSSGGSSSGDGGTKK